VIRVLVADDQALVRAGIRMLIETQPDLEVVGEAADGLAAIAAADTSSPDVVLMDIRMPRLDGIEAARRILALGPSTPKVASDRPRHTRQDCRIGAARGAAVARAAAVRSASWVITITVKPMKNTTSITPPNRSSR
jgi:DNA-binding NarL/FixJ family response regulator